MPGSNTGILLADPGAPGRLLFWQDGDGPCQPLFPLLDCATFVERIGRGQDMPGQAFRSLRAASRLPEASAFMLVGGGPAGAPALPAARHGVGRWGRQRCLQHGSICAS